MNGLYAALAARIFSQPLLAEPWAAACILGVLADRLGIDTISVPDVTMENVDLDVGLLAGVAQDFERERREYEVTREGMAVIPIQGSLMRRSASLRPRSGAVGYNAIEEATRQAMADPSVKGLLYDVDSSGGESAGCLEAARFIAGLRGTKPMWSIAGPQAASAAYALASASDRVITSQQGDVGSIGVLGIHVDRSGELSHKGHKVTIFQKGARKAEGNPFGSLSEDATRNIDARLEGLFGSFVDLTCANRNLKPEAVRSLEGATFSGQDAQKLGLVDAVMDPREAVAEFREYINGGSSRSMGVVGMHGPNAGGAAAGLTGGQGRGPVLGHIILGPAHDHALLDSAAGRLEGAAIVTFTQADLDRARSEGVTEGKAQLQSAVDAATTSGFKDGAVAERTRLSAILDSEEAKDRPALARHLAFKTEMSVEAALPVLAAGAKEVKEPPAAETAHLARLQGMDNPKLGAGEVGGEEDELGSLLKDLRKIEGRE